MAYTAIIGAAGYSGQETLDRVLAHPKLELVALGSDTLAGQPAGRLDPRLARNGRSLPAFVSNAEALAGGAELVFLCLDNERAAELEPPASGVVIDLSGAHRLRDPHDYEEWYGFVHPRPGSLADWCYALPELYPPTGRLIANPGCYATAAILALAPIAAFIDPSSVVVDAKSGVSGAGRAPQGWTPGTVLDNLTAYRVGRHQHVAEIGEALGFPVCLVPHLLPIRRGLLVTCYVQGEPSELREQLETAYASSQVVTVLPEDSPPELSRVQGTDTAEISVFEDRATGRTVVICTLDNLGKGAAGQAIQSANLLLGLQETLGLRLAGVLV